MTFEDMMIMDITVEDYYCGTVYKTRRFIPSEDMPWDEDTEEFWSEEDDEDDWDWWKEKLEKELHGKVLKIEFKTLYGVWNDKLRAFFTKEF